ncbi:segregation and condensation protein B [Caloramator quimbayensis]|uniref:Segregation and condensation protein B n=1 Tax=Caloramator quimbayensis TaxID=1147123 RepID=A0A1T4WYE4_9CLOT|nr:SMC-Scp complex subunit ScpB [Caloramator quimbayensis]SKA82269.1 segregation and condensation protein B [Caloramator quimbayensis]
MEDFLIDFQFEDDDERLKGIIEAVLFAAGDPISIKDLAYAAGVSEKRAETVIEMLEESYKSADRGLYIIRFNNKIQLSTKPEYGEYIKKLIKPEGRQNLSQAALETLSIIAYKQPITRIEIDEIRGVRSDRAIATLLERGLIKENGRLDAPGRPILYSTTDDFLKYFGFKNIKELPELIEFNLEYEEK